MRILVVEDDAPLASFLRKGLEAEHYAVDVAPDGEQARQMALESEYDLLILDLNLPKLDGIGVLNAVRPKKPSLPVLVLTARSRVETGCNRSIQAPTIASSNRFLLPNFRRGCARCCAAAREP